MQVFGVAGPDAATAVDGLAERLDGRVAVVRDRTEAPDGGVATDTPEGTTSGRTTYERTADGWRIAGDERGVETVLDDLAPDHDHAILVGMPDARVPQVALGGAEVHGDVLATAESAAALDVDAVVEAVTALEPHETLDSLVSEVKRAPGAERAGAIATFTGRVRAKDHPDDDRTEFLEFETYEAVAEDRLATICSELEDRDGVQTVRLHHRTGVVEAGEDIVFVVVLAGHREEAFRTVADGIDRLKDEVPIFKKEVTTAEEFWVHDRE